MLSKLDGVFRRPQAAILKRRLSEPHRFMQVVAGPRQVGKTTLVRQWDAARLKTGTTDALLVLDEIQEVHAWSETANRPSDGIPVDEFLTTPLESWLRSPDETKIGKKKAGRFSRSRFAAWLIFTMTPIKRIARKENALGFALSLAPP
jgi:hypothetical protein